MKINIMGKILLGFGVVLLMMLGTCLYLISGMKDIDAQYSTLITKKAYGYALAEASNGDYARAGAYLRSYIIDGNTDNATKFKEALTSGDEQFKRINPLLTTDEGKRSYGDVQIKVDAFKKYSEQIIALVEARESASEDGREAAEKQLMDYFKVNKGVISDLNDAADALSDRQLKQLDQGSEQNSADAARTITLATIIALVIIMLGFVIAFFIARMLANPIRLVDVEAAKIAAGDLTGKEIAVKSKDEVGNLAGSFNEMLMNLQDITRQLQEKSQIVASSATELSASAENVSSAVNETSSTIAEVASTVEQVAVNAQRIAEASTQAAAHANEGSEGLKSVVMQINAIQEAASASGKVVSGLSESAGKITQIVELITSIADQTNLLALNAAIESARAGEHGRGFAVVAEEVRKLAEQSAGAAKEIHTLITSIQRESQKAVESMEQSEAQVETGAQVVKEVGLTIEKIIAAVQGLTGEIQSVAAATEQMNSGVQNVAGAAEEQTATMEEVASTTQSLAALAEELDVLSKRFKLI
ncbi:methyl-accepting chemotaxis protein [Desulfocucumis palustris]|uniref:Methyl-accepting chemotaxis protein n=1 Tax=Desulfocucumis palustris TaxID=1898651 RepID=A0A2L2XBD9_9FIRM|nr:methyl-accepting chemotaxis protein [Desulfocucumis palustris]GBF33617.1 methyl-accepting chemotaxis protein [Desulfocucumis palustris]